MVRFWNRVGAIDPPFFMSSPVEFQQRHSLMAAGRYVGFRGAVMSRTSNNCLDGSALLLSVGGRVPIRS